MYLLINGVLSKKALNNASSGLTRSESVGNEITFFVNYSNFDVPIGTLFDVIFEWKNRVNYLQSTFKLIDVTQQHALSLDLIPQGYKTIAVFEYNNKAAMDFVKRIPVVNNWFESNTKYCLSSIDYFYSLSPHDLE